MILGYLWVGLVVISMLCAALSGSGGTLAGAAALGAQNGVTLAISISGALCLWSGAGRLMEEAGITTLLARIFRPLLNRLFPEARQDNTLSGVISANFCANLLGLGNAATPMGIRAAKRMAGSGSTASDSLCRLVVLNTASIQLIPTTVAAVRAALGCSAPFDILPAVWMTSFLSAAAGLSAAWCMGKLWKS